MNWRQHFRTQVDYQLWANQVLFESLSGLSAEALTRPEGLFFPSIHHTVDHMHVVADIWFARLEGRHIEADFSHIRTPDWHTLKHDLQQSIRQLGHWLESRDEALFGQTITYRRLGGAQSATTASDILTHLMGHFSHHRGQISAVATRLGAPAPEMDYLYFLRDLEAAETRMRG
ncbi:MAG: DinB family protein [Rhodocyclaceae bacterium]|nr:DinB family protein [Rhodocyclaceae bacterium]